MQGVSIRVPYLLFYRRKNLMDVMLSDDIVHYLLHLFRALVTRVTNNNNSGILILKK